MKYFFCFTPRAVCTGVTGISYQCAIDRHCNNYFYYFIIVYLELCSDSNNNLKKKKKSLASKERLFMVTLKCHSDALKQYRNWEVSCI